MNFKFAAGVVALCVSMSPVAGIAATIITDPGAAGTDTLNNNGERLSLDLNRDGHDDIQVGIGGAANLLNEGWMATLSDQFRFVGGNPNAPIQVFSIQNVQLPIFGGFVAPYQEVRIASSDGINPTKFGAGDSVDASAFSDPITGRSNLYGDVNAALPSIGDSAFFGIEISIGESEYLPLDGFLPTGFLSTPDIFYAFIEITHGSLIVNSAGYNNVAGAAAVIPGGNNPPAVPLPASAWLLGAAVAGFGTLRRKRKS